MIRWILRQAHALDQWLQTRLGRPYNVILGIGLVSEIIDRITHLGSMLQPDRIVANVLTLAVEFALLLHQLGSLSHHIERRGARRVGAASDAENEIAGSD